MAGETGRGYASHKMAYGLLALCAGLCLFLNTSIVHGAPQWRAGQAEIAPMGRAEIADTITEMVGRPDARHVVVQFDRPLTRAQQQELQQVGLKTLHYLGGQAYFASLDARRVNPAALGATSALKGVVAVKRDWKMDPRILAGHVPDWVVVGKDASGNQEVAVYVVFHPDVSLKTEAATAARRHGAVIRDEVVSINSLVVELPLSNLDALADEDAVQWIEWPLPRMSEVNDSIRAITEADIVQASPYGLDGTGVNVLIYDAGQADYSHYDFEGRLTVGAGDMSMPSTDHSTHVACTVGGGGVANPDYKGMAPKVSLVSYGYEYDGTGIFLYNNPGDIEDDYTAAIDVYGAVIANNSIGTNVEKNNFDCALQGDYGVTSQLIDAIIRGDGSNPLFTAPFRVVWSNGNERGTSRCDVEGYGDYYSTAPPAGAKNHIAVGAVNSNDDSMTYFSSWGPTDDGRMKPDMCAPGCEIGNDGGVTSCSASLHDYTTYCGTSMAAPTVTGLSSLLLQDFRTRFPGAPDPRNSTLKILLAHNAVDLGNAGPDYEYGYGSVRIQQTIDFMRTANFLENEVDQGGTFTFFVLVNPGDPELKVTLAWDDYPGTPNVNPALVNDLDLRVFDPSSQQRYPWTLDPFDPGAAAVQTQPNRVDNIEQVYVANPAAGLWRIEVHGYDVPQGPQPFSVCASPELISCSSAGTITLDATRYECSATAGIRVADCDLNANDSLIETITVSVDSTSEPAGELVVLTETGAATGDFRGSIPLDVVDSEGILLVADSDAVTAAYIDADDGRGGLNVLVTATAVVDCLPPVISNVQATNIKGNSATVLFNTNEPANGTVRYGLSCSALTESAGEIPNIYNTVHSIDLTNLKDDRTYFYAVVAKDKSEFSATDDNGGECHTFTTPIIRDYFTEYWYNDFDLEYMSLTFTPDGSEDYFSGCPKAIAGLPVDPSGGTSITPVYDDDYIQVNLNDGKTIPFYYREFDSFYVGSNGRIRFYPPHLFEGVPGIGTHFQTASISAVFTELDPLSGGTISWKQLADRAVVTWENIPEEYPYYGGPSTFQIEMHFDGTIVISYTDVNAEYHITAGLSGGGGGEPADFIETDLSDMRGCCDYNGVCGLEEDCYSCPSDCLTGIGANCGNDICETADGENCMTCPDDCNGKLGGKPDDRYCCSTGLAQYGVDCSDSRCTGGGNTCTSYPVAITCCGDDFCEGSEDGYNCEVDCGEPLPVFCGDANCDPEEDQCTCPEDCGAPPSTETNCSDGVDNDCDGYTDGDDPDCACGAKSDPCAVDTDCCSTRCVKGACK